MSIITTPNLVLNQLVEGQTGAEISVNDAFNKLDALAQIHLKSRTTTAEPGSPADGDCYLLPASSTGTHWSGNDGKVACSYQGQWFFMTVRKGWYLYVEDEDGFIYFDGTNYKNDYPKIVYAQRQNATATGSGDQVLQTVSIPANLLSTNRALRVRACVRRTTGSGNITPKVKYGGTLLSSASAASSATQIIDCLIVADGSSSAQRGFSTQFTSSSSNTDTATAAINSTTAQNLTIEVLLATSANVVTLDWLSIEVVGK